MAAEKRRREGGRAGRTADGRATANRQGAHSHDDSILSELVGALDTLEEVPPPLGPVTRRPARRCGARDKLHQLARIGAAAAAVARETLGTTPARAARGKGHERRKFTTEVLVLGSAPPPRHRPSSVPRPQTLR